jgi:hypothetical protein
VHFLLLGVALGEVLLRERRADGEHLLGVLPRGSDRVTALTSPDVCSIGRLFNAREDA